MKLIELINLLPQDNKDLVYKAYKIWFELLYEEYEYNESLVTEFIYDLFNQNIKEDDMTNYTETESVYRDNCKNAIVFKFKDTKSSNTSKYFDIKLNEFINEYQ